MTATTAVQILYEGCKASFGSAGDTPAPEAIDRVCAALDNIRCSDVGLEEDRIQGQLVVNGRSSRFPNSVTRFVPPITYLHLYECDKFSMGIFCLPQSAIIPLHNHPGMTVFSKLLYGSMHVKSFDWADPFDERLNADPSIPRLAKRVKDHVLLAPCPTSILYPAAGGNIHSFTAVTPCAVLDVLAPPYSSSAGRHCVYYKPSPAGRGNVTPPAGVSSSPGETENSENWLYLEEFQPPPSFAVQAGNYRGPKVVATRS